MSDPISYVMTTKRPKILQQMLKDIGYMEWFESTVETNELHIGGRTSVPEKIWMGAQDVIKNYSKQYPVVVQSWCGAPGESIKFFVFKNGKLVFVEDFSYTREQLDEVYGGKTEQPEELKV